MTENEAIKDLKDSNEQCLRICESACSNIENNQCNCSDGVIERMLDELLQYREIATVAECREAAEKQNQKPLDFYGDSEDGKLLCPNCGNDLWELKECGFNNCPYCGQVIQWNENLEGMEDGTGQV